MSRDERELELEIVSNSWLSLTDADGFDALVASWSDKINGLAHPDAEDETGLVDTVVERQLRPILSMLDSDTEPRHRDPLQRELAKTRGAAMVLSPDGTVAAVANGADRYFGVRVGRLANSHWMEENSRADYDALRRGILRQGNTGYAILRVRAADGAEALAEAYGLTTKRYAGIFTVVRSLELNWSEAVGEKLEAAYGLTGTEVEICRLLLRWRDLDAVSRRRGVTQGTGRVQLKRIFAKMDLHSKADLVRLLAMLCARSPKGQDATDLKWSDPLARETFLKRPGGRKLAYTWIGAENGREAISVHGELPHFYLPPETQRMLAAANIKLICVSMPGHGSSDPAPRGVSQLDDGLAALDCLIAHLGRRLPIIGSESGIVHAITLACRLNPPVSAALIFGIPWYLTPDAYRDLPMIQKTLSQLALRSPAMFELVCRLGWRAMLREGPDFYLKRALSGSQSDQRIVQDADMQPYLRAACRHLVAQGHRAFMRETLTSAKVRPAQLLASLAVPLHWAAPAEEAASTERNRRIAKGMNSRISVETIADAGELMPYQRPEIFVRCIADLVSDDPARKFAMADDYR